MWIQKLLISFLLVLTNHLKDFQDFVIGADSLGDLVVVPIATAKIQSINGIDPRTYIESQNPSYWVIQEERRISWVDKPASNNPIVEGQWWEDNPSDQMYISFDHDAAEDLGIKINDTITLSIYGRDVSGIVKTSDMLITQILRSTL